MGDMSWLLDRAGGYLQVQARFTDASTARDAPWPSPRPSTARTTLRSPPA